MTTNVRQYRDLDLNFTRNPATGDIAFRTGDQAVIRSVRNLINLSYYEKPFHPEIGSSVNQMLFEPMSPLTAQHLKNHVQDVIDNFEPRVKLDQVVVQAREDQNQFEVFIRFYILNNSSPTTVTVFLERVR